MSTSVSVSGSSVSLSRVDVATLVNIHPNTWDMSIGYRVLGGGVNVLDLTYCRSEPDVVSEGVVIFVDTPACADRLIAALRELKSVMQAPRFQERCDDAPRSGATLYDAE
jgi:hypothetical protein